MVAVEARDGDDLNLEILICISPNDHAKLFNREQSAVETETDEYSMDQEIAFSHLLGLCGDKDAFLPFSKWYCTQEWFHRYLMVPYEP